MPAHGTSNKTATTGKDSFKCKDCVYASETRKSDVLRHYKQVHATGKAKRDMSYICNNDNCGKEFIQRSNAETHAIIHTGEKPFTCKICKTSFVDKSPLSKPCLVANVNGTVKHSMLKTFDKAAFMRKHAAVYNKITPPVRDATEEEKQVWVVLIPVKNESVKPIERAVPKKKKAAGKASRSKKGRKEEDVESEDGCDGLEALFYEDDIEDVQSEPLISVDNTTRIVAREASPGTENEIPPQQIRAAEDIPFNNNFDIPGRTFYNDQHFNQPTSRGVYDVLSNMDHLRTGTYYPMDSFMPSEGILESRSPSPPPVSYTESFERAKIYGQPGADDIEAAMILLDFATTMNVTASSESYYGDDDVEEAAKGLLELAAGTPLPVRALDTTPVTSVGGSSLESLSSVSFEGHYDSEMVEAAMILVQLGFGSRRELGSDSRAGTPSTVVGAPSPAETQTSTIAVGSRAVSADGERYDSVCPAHCKGCENLKRDELEFAGKA
ncbi:hypothetical protein CYLTODRAFT_454805 [Cylindrobasidium torrendii FP15055 ss-10]|uniref:C2H2-type domain-containing protein n=1 Tax=Cylindrobasidium torrendii FP15055 ss-10 TaxID=1314674 RepID=A0A0D7B9Y1_9AGAR|nr:hypothetical protein CYLTODRAFT_454805 [Cylindrobasidium torrendii FP15055 ss-10]